MNEIRLRSAACVSSTWRNEYLSDVLSAKHGVPL